MPHLDDIGLYYEDAGNGQAVILLHGLGLSMGLWEEQGELAEEFRLVRYDARGAGRSAAPSPGYDANEAAADLLGLLDRLEIERAHLVGHARRRRGGSDDGAGPL